jgi:hypothetical protein
VKNNASIHRARIFNTALPVRPITQTSSSPRAAAPPCLSRGHRGTRRILPVTRRRHGTQFGTVLRLLCYYLLFATTGTKAVPLFTPEGSRHVPFVIEHRSIIGGRQRKASLMRRIASHNLSFNPLTHLDLQTHFSSV